MPCAHPCLPGPVRACCNCLSLATLGLQCCLGVTYALLGCLALALTPASDVGIVYADFQATKVAAFVGAVPTALLIYALVRWCESGRALPPVQDSRGGMLL